MGKWVKSDKLSAWDFIKVGFVSTLAAVAITGIIIWGFF